MFWKKKEKKITIQCSVCEWQPDGGKHWACTCGKNWNTFKTKAKCPSCNIQWKETQCPACGKTTSHKSWYKTKEEILQIEKTGNQMLRAKKKSIEAQLIKYGIYNYRVAHLPYLDHSQTKFQSTYNAACRMIILYYISYATYNLNERDRIINWFKKEGIWNKVSPLEKDFLQDPSPEEEECMTLSWRVDGAVALAWCLHKVTKLSKLNKDDKKEVKKLLQNLPSIGDKILPFVKGGTYRDFGEIFQENLLNEMVTTYYRDLMFYGGKDKTRINALKSYERHLVLNWLRSPNTNEQEVTGELWDETDTST